MNLNTTLGLERLGWVRPKEKAVEMLVVRTTVVTSGEMYDAVQQLRKYLEYPASYPNVEFIKLEDDLKPRKKKGVAGGG